MSAMGMLILVTLLIPLVLEHGYAGANITLVVTTVIDVVMVSSRKSGIRQEKDINLFVNVRVHNIFSFMQFSACNCHGHSESCVYEEEIDNNNLSLDIHGNYEGGGKCLNCRDNTEGINCNKCVFGYYRPNGKFWNETDVCRPCSCNPEKHTGACADGTGTCECLPQFTGPNCDQCAAGYYHPPECRPCECNVDGTLGALCLPLNEKCPCKPNYGGDFCQTCAPGYTNLTAGCLGINLDFFTKFSNLRKIDP